MGEEAVVGEAVGEETTTQRSCFWAKIVRTKFSGHGGQETPRKRGVRYWNFPENPPVTVPEPTNPLKKEKLEIDFSKSDKIHHIIITINKLVITDQTKICTLDGAKRWEKNLAGRIFGGRGAGDATKTGRSVLKFSAESASDGPGARKSPKNGKAENNCWYWWWCFITTTITTQKLLFLLLLIINTRWVWGGMGF